MGNWCANKDEYQKKDRGEFTEPQPNPQNYRREASSRDIEKQTNHVPPPPNREQSKREEIVIPPPTKINKQEGVAISPPPASRQVVVPDKSPAKRYISDVSADEGEYHGSPSAVILKPPKNQKKRDNFEWDSKTSGDQAFPTLNYNNYNNNQYLNPGAGTTAQHNQKSQSSWGELGANSSKPHGIQVQ